MTSEFLVSDGPDGPLRRDGEPINVDGRDRIE